ENDDHRLKNLSHHHLLRDDSDHNKNLFAAKKLKLSFSTPETRLVKWMFTAMVVTPDGKGQPEGLVYSPEQKLNVKKNHRSKSKQ
ncbi:MAG: hypothetical protein PHO11_07670, partial [Bacteroidales bacterium]|nr:hypothetical protein [Bacteroidales bacterium]